MAKAFNNLFFYTFEMHLYKYYPHSSKLLSPVQVFPESVFVWSCNIFKWEIDISKHYFEKFVEMSVRHLLCKHEQVDLTARPHLKMLGVAVHATLPTLSRKK